MSEANETAPRVLAISGLEPSGRAGLLADLEAIRGSGGVALAIASALTAQGTKTFALEPVEPRTVAAQIRALLELGEVAAVKLGMVPDRRVLDAAWKALPQETWRVMDPVVRTSRGERLSSLEPRDYLRRAGPRVVITPNLDEAAWLVGEELRSRDVAEARRLAHLLEQREFGGVVVKGGHLAGAPVDVLATEAGVTVLRGRRLERAGKRGTGCRFASALATELARGASLEGATRAAKRYVAAYLRVRR